MQLIGNGTLITHNNVQPLIENGCVVMNGGLIEDFGTTQEMKAKYPEHEFVDAQGRIIMPGLINNHTHIYSEFARGMSISGAPVSKNFTEILENLWFRVDKTMNLDDVRYSAYGTYIECIKNGVTTVFDHHASYGAIRDSLFTIGEVAEELGVRTSLCYEVSDRAGEAATDEAIKENIAWIDHTIKNKNDMQKGMFGLHASFTLSDETLNKCREAIEGKGVGYHVHIAEGIADLQETLKKTSKRVVNRFYDYGVLGDKTLAVHCIHINGAEMDLLKETNTAVIHNPESNMGNAVGCSPILSMIDKGILLGLGTDAYTSDMLESLKVANIIHKHNLCDPSAVGNEPSEMLFYNNREITGRFFDTPVGIIDKGAAADVILVDYDAPTPVTEGNIYGHIMFGLSGARVDTVIINGKIIMKNRILCNVDEKEILSKTRNQAKDFWGRI